MLPFLWLIPALPLAGFLVLASGLIRDSRLVRLVGAGSVGGSLVAAALVCGGFLLWPPPGDAYVQTLWSWIRAEDFQAGVTFRLDALSALMVLVVTVISFLVHLFAADYMARDKDVRRFFAHMNFFVASMLLLVLADNLLLLYVGWEGVGLSSYLLIGFWRRDPLNDRNGMKAFLVTRAGDAAFAIGLIVMATSLGSPDRGPKGLDIQEVAARAGRDWPVGSGIAVAAAALLLAGAAGKSAQVPLQVWLPDAMVGPTPVSALLHSATMVTAGVYLLLRMHALLVLAPAVMAAVAAVGPMSLLLAGCCALAEHDIKRILAYSTISQIGYMFLAIGAGAWSAAAFHFATHAFFKSLLFMGAGVIIACSPRGAGLSGEHDILRMGGLRKQLPRTFWIFLAAILSLVAVPPVTAGFGSKDLLLYELWSSPHGGPGFWLVGWIGAAITACYSFRLLLHVFFGPARQQAKEQLGPVMLVPMLILATVSAVGGVVVLPKLFGSDFNFLAFLAPVLPQTPHAQAHTSETLLQFLALLASLAGAVLAWLAWRGRPAVVAAAVRSAPATALRRLWQTNWGFDWIYQQVLVRPWLALARINRQDVLDLLPRLSAWLAQTGHEAMSALQTGRLGWYAAGVGMAIFWVFLILVFA